MLHPDATPCFGERGRSSASTHQPAKSRARGSSFRTGAGTSDAGTSGSAYRHTAHPACDHGWRIADRLTEAVEHLAAEAGMFWRQDRRLTERYLDRAGLEPGSEHLPGALCDALLVAVRQAVEGLLDVRGDARHIRLAAPVSVDVLWLHAAVELLLHVRLLPVVHFFRLVAVVQEFLACDDAFRPLQCGIIH